MISKDTVIICRIVPLPPPKTPQKTTQNFHTYFFGLIVYLFQNES